MNDILNILKEKKFKKFKNNIYIRDNDIIKIVKNGIVFKNKKFMLYCNPQTLSAEIFEKVFYNAGYQIKKVEILKNKKIFNKVYKFFEGEMTEKEKMAFHHELLTNIELKKEYDLQKQLNKFLDNDLNDEMLK